MWYTRGYLMRIGCETCDRECYPPRSSVAGFFLHRLLSVAFSPAFSTFSPFFISDWSWCKGRRAQGRKGFLLQQRMSHFICTDKCVFSRKIQRSAVQLEIGIGDASMTACNYVQN